MRIMQNGECNLNILDIFFLYEFECTSIQSLCFAIDYEFWIGVNEYYRSSKHSNSNFAHHIVIHWSLFKV